MTKQHCRLRTQIDRHFVGDSTPRMEQKMRLHLSECDDCYGYYQRHMLLCDVDPQAKGAEERIARGLGISPRKSRTPQMMGVMTALGVAAGIAVFATTTQKAAGPTLVPGEAVTHESDFVARGTEAQSRIFAFRVDNSGSHLPAVKTIGTDDELAFGYDNVDGKKYLMVFGVDSTGDIHWYHPAWTDPATTPIAVAITQAPGFHELPSVVSHDLQVGALLVHAVFLNEPLTVLDVEALVSGKGVAQLEVKHRAIVDTVPLQVEKQ